MRSGPIQILFIFLLSGLFPLHAQINRFGVPLITSYPLKTHVKGQFRSFTLDHRGLIYLGDPDLGLMEYDGSEWRNIPGTANLGVMSLVTGENGVIYVGGKGDFGLLESDPLGQLYFHSLCDSARRMEDSLFTVQNTYFSEGQVLFCSDQDIFRMDPLTRETAVIATGNQAYKAFVANNKLYCADSAEGLTILVNNHFAPLPGGDFFAGKQISNMARLDNGPLLVATLTQGVYLMDPATGEINSFFEHQVTDLKVLGQKIYACTANQGLYILNLQGKILEIISETQGLPDNSISGIFIKDEQNERGPVWITHPKGVSKLDINNPLRIYAGDMEFEDEITDMVRFNGLLFVSSLSGLYYQTQTSSGSSFRKLSKLPGPVFDLLLFQAGRYRSMLLASTAEGIFIIHQNMWVAPLVPTLNPDHGDTLNTDLYGGKVILADPQRSGVIYTGLNKVVGLQYSRGRWSVIFRSEIFDQEIRQMVRDHYGYLWVSTAGRLSRIDMELAPAYITTEYAERDDLPFDKDISIFLKPKSKGLWVGCDSGFYLFDYFHEDFIPDSVFNSILPPEAGRIGNFFADRDGDYWISYKKEHHSWTELVVRVREKRPGVLIERPLLRLPSSAPASGWSGDPESGVWISKSRELYYFDKAGQVNHPAPFHTLIRKVIINSDSGLYLGADMELERPRIDYRYNTIGFYWAGTSFEGADSLEYSYFLNGSGSSWSDWESNRHIEFSDLRFGRYTLEVKARNIYGQESDPAGFSFIIKRPWYAAYPAILSYILLGALIFYLILKRFRK